MNLRLSIKCFTEALRFFTAETTPHEYAETQYNLGNAYTDLLVGDRSANLGRAIACYTAALRSYTAETNPYEYAQTLGNLGNAYSQLLTGDRAGNLGRAITCFTEALRFFTAETTLYEYADAVQPGHCLLPSACRGSVRQSGPGDHLLHRGATVLHCRVRPG